MTAGLRINGQDYTLDALRQVPMGDLFVLKSFTHDKGYGVSLKSINAMFEDLGAKAAADKFDPMDLLDDNGFLANMVGLVYLVRRAAGDDIAVKDAWGTAFNAVEFIDDEDDGEAGELPKDGTLEPVPSGS